MTIISLNKKMNKQNKRINNNMKWSQMSTFTRKTSGKTTTNNNEQMSIQSSKEEDMYVNHSCLHVKCFTPWFKHKSVTEGYTALASSCVLEMVATSYPMYLLNHLTSTLFSPDVKTSEVLESIAHEWERPPASISQGEVSEQLGRRKQ